MRMLSIACMLLAAAGSPLPRGAPTTRSARVACTPGNGGLALPDGFCAVVVGRDLGRVRHLAVAPNGDVFANVATRGIVALRDTTGDGVADVTRRFGQGGTGVALADGWLYYATNDAVYRYAWSRGQLEPRGDPETIVRGLPTGGHEAKSVVIGGGDALYVSVGSQTNSCQQKDRGDRSPGRDPCPELETRAGVWRFSASRAGQSLAEGQRYATGLRNPLGLAIHPGTGTLWATVHGRDQLAQNWGFDERKSAENPGEELVRIDRGGDFGWPYCYYDVDLKTKVLAPEYGGDGMQVGRCAKAEAPVAVYPGHWAPMAVAFGRGGALGETYANGAFIAFHGSWNRAPLPQAGYRVVWQPLAGGKPSQAFATFATGTAGDTSLRPSGLAVGPDGSLYIAADANGTIWRVVRSPDTRAQSAGGAQDDGPRVGDKAPDFTLPAATREGVSARPMRLSDFPGQTVVLAFFFKAPPRAERSKMDAYRDQYAQLFNGGQNVVLLAISADTPEALASWAKDAGYPFRFLSDTAGEVGQLYGAWMAEQKLDRRSLFVVGPDGRIVYRQTPFREVDPAAYVELGEAIDALAR